MLKLWLLLGPEFTVDPYPGDEKARTKKVVDTWPHKWQVHFQLYSDDKDKTICVRLFVWASSSLVGGSSAEAHHLG